MNASATTLGGGPTEQLAEFAAGCTFEQIPTEIVQLYQTFLLDNAATLLAGAVQPVHADVAKAMNIATGSGTVEAVGGAKVPLSTAVLLDGICAADFEFEHVNPNSHPASSTFPAILALAAERHCSGKELLTAMAVAYEVTVRIGNANTPAAEKRGFHNPGITGAPGAAAGCCRLLGLNAATTASAMGIAASSSAGLLAFVTTGAMTKRLHPGRAAQLGLEAALMAQAGVEGPRDVFENKQGYLSTFSPQPDIAN